LVNYLEGFVTDNKKAKFHDILPFRTRHLTVILEDIFQPHNASAVLRTADCFGIQDIHIIENKNRYEVNPEVALGASKWVNIEKYHSNENNTLECIRKLKSEGYKIIATVPDFDSIAIDELPLDKKIALGFGTELTGLTDVFMENCDGKCHIPMYGFTESLNISVSAAIFLFRIMQRLHQSDISWRLSEDEVLDTRLQWLRSIIRRSELIEQDYLKKSENRVS